MISLLSMAVPGGLLAHQGGWDEIGLVAVPLIIVAALLVLANRRAKRVLADTQAEQFNGAEGANPAEGTKDMSTPSTDGVQGDHAPADRP